MYADSEGETHFEDVEANFKQSEFRPGVGLFGVTDPKAASDTFFVHTPMGFSDRFHPTPKRLLIVVLTGENEITATDGETRRFGPSEVMIMDDVGSKGHKSIASNCTFMFVSLA